MLNFRKFKNFRYIELRIPLFFNFKKSLGDWVHSQCITLPQGKTCMKYGLYTSRGTCQCSTSEYHGPGSHGFEKQDAQFFADAGADFLKEDSCCGNQTHSVAFAVCKNLIQNSNMTFCVLTFNFTGLCKNERCVKCDRQKYFLFIVWLEFLVRSTRLFAWKCLENFWRWE